MLAALPDRLRAEQRLFDSTGGVHAAALFDAEGSLLVLREDVGRHNAVDKVVGWALREGRLPLSRRACCRCRGRASFELVQKARMAGIPVLAAVSAPSSLAAELAEEAGITLVGFSRGTSFNVYAGGGRVRRTGAPLDGPRHRIRTVERAGFVGADHKPAEPRTGGESDDALGGTTVRAAVLRATGEPLSVEDVELDPPAPARSSCASRRRASATATCTT